METIRAALGRKHPALRAAGPDATAEAAEAQANAATRRTTRGRAAQATKQAALHSAVAGGAAERVQALAKEQEPLAAKRLSKKLAKAEVEASKAPPKGKDSSAPAKKPARQAPPRKRKEPPTEAEIPWLDKPRVSFEMVKSCPRTRKAVPTLTNMPGPDSLIGFYDYLNRDGKADTLTIYNYRGDGCPEGRGAGATKGQVRKARPGGRAMTGPDAYLMTLILLKWDFTGKLSEWMFGVDERTLAPYYVSWVLFMEQELRAMMPIPTQEQVEATAPPQWKEVYGRVPRMVIDATELAMQSPSGIENYRAHFSQYKHGITAKILAAISPAGAFVWASDPFPGRASDQCVSRHSGLMELLQSGELVAADKGFNIDNMLLEIGCGVAYPPKLRKGRTEGGHRKQHAADKAQETTRHANLRIHVERLFARCKAWRKLKMEQKLLTVDLLGAVFRVIAYMTNFQKPLVSKQWRKVTKRRTDGPQSANDTLGNAPPGHWEKKAADAQSEVRRVSLWRAVRSVRAERDGSCVRLATVLAVVRSTAWCLGQAPIPHRSQPMPRHRRRSARVWAAVAPARGRCAACAT